MGQTFTFNGKEITQDELNAKLKELSQLTKMKAEAKKAGLTVGAATVPKVKPPEVTLLAKSFEPILVTNAGIIAKLFTETYKGQDSISMNINENYAVIIRDRKITASKAEARKAEATEKVERAELAALILKPALDEKETARLNELNAKYPEPEVKE